MKPSEFIKKNFEGWENENYMEELDERYISKEKYDDLHKDFLKMEELCSKAQNKLRQAKKELKEKIKQN